MSKHNILTEEELSTHVISESLIRRISGYCEKYQLKSDQVRILDWGCGRGKDVLCLRNIGYSAFGVDIDPEPISKGSRLCKNKGYDSSVLNLLDASGKTEFPDEYFSFTYSNYVFEHVEDLEIVAEELSRISSKNSSGYHVFPSREFFFEGHLFMPFVHWLPKNRVRRYLILLFLFIGLGPDWENVKNKMMREKVDVFYDYTITKTHYRKYSEIKNIFERAGFKVRHEIKRPDKLQKYGKLYKLATTSVLKQLVNDPLIYFNSIGLTIDK